MTRRTNYGLWVDDDGKPSKNELAIDYIVESARSVGIEVIEGKTALDIQFMAEVMKRLRKKQEPCEDAISRKALLEEIENGIKAGNYEEGYEEYPHINDMNDIIECIKYADSIQPKPKTDVIDNIRAEIDEQYDRVYPYNISCAEGLEMALEIIDKYKAEKE